MLGADPRQCQPRMVQRFGLTEYNTTLLRPYS